MRTLNLPILCLGLLAAPAVSAATAFEQISPTPTSYVLTADYNTASFNPASVDVTGDLFATSGSDPIATDGLSLGCDAGSFGSGVAGKIALVSRGACEFQLKASFAQAAGAIGLLVVENDPRVMGAAGMGGANPSLVIPSFRLTIPLGTALTDLARRQSVTVRMATGLPDAVPEPAAWSMMLLGFGAIGALARRRRSRIAFA